MSLEAGVGTEGIGVLSDLLPSFCKIIGGGGNRVTTSQWNRVGDIGRWMQHENRFNYIFRLFAGAIAGPTKPIILFLDNLHWADTASLNILRSFLLDSDDKSM
eukprot:11531304-Ditylum_brightwellii.AAC.1